MKIGTQNSWYVDHIGIHIGDEADLFFSGLKNLALPSVGVVEVDCVERLDVWGRQLKLQLKVPLYFRDILLTFTILLVSVLTQFVSVVSQGN